MNTVQLTAADLEEAYVSLTIRAIAECTFVTDMVGGVPATEEGVRAFVAYQMKLEGDEAEKAAKRIMAEEIGENTPNLGEGEELEEREVYGINVIRHDEFAPWLGNWQVKACLKAAASRVGLFVKKRGSKGDMAEMGRVEAHGLSLLGDHPERIHIIGPATRFEKFMGRVNTPQGSKSIVHWSEVMPAGSEFAFELRVGSLQIKGDDLTKTFAVAQNIGLGSCKAMERGKFRVDRLEIET